MTTDTITDQERETIRRHYSRIGRQGFEKRLTHFLAEVDRATPGLPADERQERATQLFAEFMAEAGRKSGESRWARGASRRKGGTPRRTKTI
jgi:hypothetical protein